MTVDATRPVLVVGAGPTGLTAAMELARLGVDVRIVDRNPVPANTSRALGVQARTVELLRPRGVGDELLRLGTRAHRTVLYDSRRRLGAIEFGAMPSRYRSILLLPQSQTERLLTAQLGRHGGKVERSVEVRSLTQTADGVVAELRSADGATEVVHAAYVIAADGAHSAIRKALGLPFAGRALAQRYLLADARAHGALPSDQLTVFTAPHGFVAAFPLSGNRFRFMLTDCGEVGELTATRLQQRYDAVSPLPATMSQLEWTSEFRINSRHMATLRAGRIFFGGDAAHIHSPAGGQGMNAGIQDMINLSWKLALVLRGAAAPALLDTYQTDRLPVIHRLVRFTERATRVFTSTRRPVHAVLRHVAPAVLRRRRVQCTAASVLGQVAAGYRHADLARGGGRLGALRAGDRLPDVSVNGSAPVSIYDHLDTAGLTLFANRTPAPDLAPWRDVVTVSPIDTDELPAGLLLVRPDGYLAAAGRRTAVLTRWLQRWFPRPV